VAVLVGVAVRVAVDVRVGIDVRVGVKDGVELGVIVGVPDGGTVGVVVIVGTKVKVTCDISSAGLHEEICNDKKSRKKKYIFWRLFLGDILFSFYDGLDNYGILNGRSSKIACLSDPVHISVRDVLLIYPNIYSIRRHQFLES
jgi:hypothetical protein